MDEPQNGSRYVTHQRLQDVLDVHRREESTARHELANRVVTLSAHTDLEGDVRAIRDRVDGHEVRITSQETRWHRLDGMMSLGRIAFGASILSALASVIAIWVALR